MHRFRARPGMKEWEPGSVPAILTIGVGHRSEIGSHI
jgi:hypothetical protein